MCCEGLVEKFPQVDSCCFCCKVETGSKIIAWLGAVGAFFYTIVVIVGLVAFATESGQTTPENKDAMIAVGIAVSVFLLVFLVFFWVMALVLLIGLYKEDMSKVRAWLRVNICLFFFAVVGVVLSIISAISAPKGSGGMVATNIISGIVQLVLSLYMICVVKSHYVNKTQGFQNVRA